MQPTETIPSTLPHSREAEEAVLGAVLINPFVFSELGLDPDAFYVHRNRFVWKAFRSLRDKSRDIDNLTVAEELDSLGLLSEVGGPAFLTYLLNQVPTTLHAAGYAAIIREHYTRRLLLQAANEMARLSFSSELGVTEMLASAQEALRKVASQVSEPEQLVDISDAAGDLYDAALERARLASEGKPIVSQRVPTGLLDVDKLLKGGLRPGSLNLVAGRPGQGKSSLMQTIAIDAMNKGKRVGFFSLEMKIRELTARMLSAASGLDANILSEGLLSDTQWETLISTLETLHSGRLFLSDLANLTPASLRAQAWQMKSRCGLDLLVVDYVQLMRPGMRFQSREQEVAYCSRELKLLAGELDIPVLAAAQMNRDSEVRVERDPQLSDLRESGALENDADVVMFIWRPDQAVNISRLKIAKHRGGPVGIADLFFDAKLTRFANLERRDKS